MRTALIVALSALSGAYFYGFFLRVIGFWLPGLRRAWLRGSALAALLLVAALCALPSPEGIYSDGLIWIGHVFAFSLALDCAHFAWHRIRGRRNGASRARLWRSGVLPILLAALTLCLGRWNMLNVRETDYALRTQKALRADGYRVALVSDLHAGTTLRAEALAKACEAISAREPDLVVLCGDIIDERSTPSDVAAAFAALGDIRAEFGVYFVRGNHENRACRYSPDLAAALERALAENDIAVLEDASCLINGELLLVGRADRGLGGDAARASTAALLSGADAANFILLLDHQPVGFAENRAAGVDLQLSGHTHDGQLWPIGLFNRLLGLTDLTYGQWTEGGFSAIVSSGMGGWRYAVRTEGRSEYVIIDVRTAEAQS